MQSKLAIVHPFLDVRGGAERKILLLWGALLSEGISVDFLTFSFDREKTFSELIPKGAEPIVLEASSKWSWAMRAFLHLAPKSYDGIIISNHPAQVPAVLSSLARKTRLYWICNEVLPKLEKEKTGKTRWFDALDRKLVSRIDHIVANSEFTAGEIKSYYGRSPEVIRSGVSVSIEFEESRVGRAVRDAVEGRDFWVSLGRIEKHKNFDLVVRLAQERPSDLFAIAGDGSYRSHLEEEAKRLPNLKILGPVSQDEKMFLLQNAKGFLFTPLEEPLGVTVMEALAHNTPVVAFNAGGPKEVVLAGENGILADTETEFAKALDLPLFKGKLPEKVGFSYVQDKFSNHRMLRDFQASIQRCLFP